MSFVAVWMCVGEFSLHRGLLEFVPSSDLPGLQYVEHVDEGGSACDAGLLPGDFILEVLLTALFRLNQQ